MFRRSSLHPIIVLIIGLAGFGLLYQLFKNPLALIGEILIAAVIVGVIYMLYKFVIQRRFGGFGQSQAKYRKAAAQSNKKYRDPSTQLAKVRGLSQKTQTIKKSIRSHQASKRREHNLTVIEGKKSKKKNRAFF